MEIPFWGWIVFGVVLVALLAVDVFSHRGERADSVGWAAVWTGIWIAAGLLFSGFVWAVFGLGAAEEYLAAYLIEKSLSVDNLFVFLVIFQTLGIPREHQRKALTYGIVGALVFRAIFIVAGIHALERWEWTEWIFAAILVVAAWRAFREDPAETERESRLITWLERHLPVTREHHEGRFVVRKEGRRLLTPLAVAVIGLELTDILFAVDSVPAALSVSRSAFIVYSSNVFAILGLRALYIVLARALSRLRYVHYGIGVILLFTAAKMVADRWVEIEGWASILIILAIIAVTFGLSVRESRRRTGSWGLRERSEEAGASERAAGKDEEEGRNRE